MPALLFVAASVAVLTVFGLHRASLVHLLRRRGNCRHGIYPPPASVPAVTVQLPIYNEQRVCRRAIDAACGLRWPRGSLEVQVLDDSTDETRAIVDDAARVWRERGVDVRVVRRPTRAGYKAGALAHGTAIARGELLCVLDADFVVPPDFLERVTPAFAAPDVGMVQARWSHLNECGSLLTRAQAVFLDAHFVIEQAARAAAERWFNFNGTAGIWRRSCVEDAGGWHSDTLSEDVDLSYRAQLRGWRFVYLDDVAVPAELPPTMLSFKIQQRRWTTGLSQAARKLLGPVWHANATLTRRVEASLHLSSPLASLATTLLGIALPIVVASNHIAPTALAIPLCVGSIGAAVFYLAAQHRLGRSFSGTLHLLPAIFALGIGIAASNMIGCVVALFRRSVPFERTPKMGSVDGEQALNGRAQVTTSAVQDELAVVVVEIALAMYVGLWFASIVRGGEVSVGSGFVLLFFAGYSWVSAASARELFALRRDRGKRLSASSALVSPAVSPTTLPVLGEEATEHRLEEQLRHGARAAAPAAR
jgi:hypothetical protein